MATFHGWAAPARGRPLEPYAFAAPKCGAMDVEVDVTHCGICHSDVHLIDDDWAMSTYPLVPGHEVVGMVRKLGSAVSNLEIGERVGIGWQSGSCQDCEWCQGAAENLCAASSATAVGRAGGYADRIVVDSRFAFAIPDALDSAEAAPLLCGGATVFSPLLRYRASARTRLGIVGLGGLGHMAVQFGQALGAHVTAFSTTASKRDDAREMGADAFVPLNDAAAMSARANSLDLVLTTASADLPWPSLVAMLRPTGTLCVLGAAPNELHFPAFPLITGNRSVSGSNTGSRAEIVAMLRFAAEHGVRSHIERFAMDDVNAALERVRSGQVRYRVVLEA